MSITFLSCFQLSFSLSFLHSASLLLFAHYSFLHCIYPLLTCSSSRLPPIWNLYFCFYSFSSVLFIETRTITLYKTKPCLIPPRGPTTFSCSRCKCQRPCQAMKSIFVHSCLTALVKFNQLASTSKLSMMCCQTKEICLLSGSERQGLYKCLIKRVVIELSILF